MALLALLSNPQSTGNRSMLPQVRQFCEQHGEIFHYEVEEAGQIGKALATIACVRPKILVINGGDGTVQAALTELYQGGHFGDTPPPVAVLPNGKTNLIAMDLGMKGSPLEALEQLLAVARGDMSEHLVVRQMIALSNGDDSRPVLGMFLGGAGLAEFILYCRHKIYPLGLPNGLSHVLAGIAGFISILFKVSVSFLPRRSSPMRVVLVRGGEMQGTYSLLIITTLEKLLLSGSIRDWHSSRRKMKLMMIDQSAYVMLRAIMAMIFGRFGRQPMNGVHLIAGDEIRIEGDNSNVILDGEIFSATPGHPITLRSTPPVPFVRLAA